MVRKLDPNILQAVEDKKTASDMVAMLRKHYLPESKPPGGILIPEIQSPDGSRRADALWVPTTSYDGSMIVGHEIKVSRADVMQELKDPTKVDPWAQYCNYWILVVSDPALIEGLEIPEYWGILSPPSGRRRITMTYLRQPTQLYPKEQARAFKKILSWYMWHVKSEADTAVYRANRLAQENLDLKKKIEDKSALMSGQFISPHSKRINEILFKIKELTNDNHIWVEESMYDEAIVEVAVDLILAKKVAKEVRRDIRRMVQHVSDISDPFKHTQKKLDLLMEMANETFEPYLGKEERY